MDSRLFTLPLRVREIRFNRLDAGYDIESADGMEICRMAENCDRPEVNAKDAATIVHAVNHHDELVDFVDTVARGNTDYEDLERIAKAILSKLENLPNPDHAQNS